MHRGAGLPTLDSPFCAVDGSAPHFLREICEVTFAYAEAAEGESPSSRKRGSLRKAGRSPDLSE